METGGMIYIHAIRASLIPQLNWIIEPIVKSIGSFTWREQPTLEHHRAAAASWTGRSGDIAVLASALCELPGIYFEISERGHETNLPGWIMHTPSLGIFYSDTDPAGNFLVSEDRIRSIYEKAAGDPDLLLQQFSLALGEAWNEELEPLRPISQPSNVVSIDRSS